MDWNTEGLVVRSSSWSRGGILQLEIWSQLSFQAASLHWQQPHANLFCLLLLFLWNNKIWSLYSNTPDKNSGTCFWNLFLFCPLWHSMTLFPTPTPQSHGHYFLCSFFFSSFFNPFLNSFLLLYLQWSSFKVHISTLLFSLYSVSDTAYNYHISFSLFVVDNNVVFINSWPFLKLCVHISNALLNMINGICCHPIKLNVSKQTLLQWVLPPLNLIMYYQSSSPQGLKPWCYLFNFLLFIVPKPPVHQYSRDVNNSF